MTTWESSKAVEEQSKIDGSAERLNTELSTSDSFALESSKEASQSGWGTGRRRDRRRWGRGRRGKGEAELDVYTTWISAIDRAEEGDGRRPAGGAIRCCVVTHFLHGKVAPPWEFIFLENTRSSIPFLISLSPSTPEKCNIKSWSGLRAKVTQWLMQPGYKHWITQPLMGSFFLWCKIEVWIGKDLQRNLERKFLIKSFSVIFSKTYLHSFKNKPAVFHMLWNVFLSTYKIQLKYFQTTLFSNNSFNVGFCFFVFVFLV